MWYVLVIPTGCYELSDINKELQRQILAKTNKKNILKLEPNLNTLKCIMTLSPGTKVDMTIENSLKTLLGFEKKVYTNSRNESEKSVDIMKVNSLLIHCNLIESSYLNGELEPILHSFFPGALPGEKILEYPKSPIYLPISLSTISNITSWITDQDGSPINLRGEKLSLKFHIRAC